MVQEFQFKNLSGDTRHKQNHKNANCQYFY